MGWSSGGSGAGGGGDVSTAVANTFVVGNQRIETASDTERGLTVKRFSGTHSAALFALEDDLGALLATLNADGGATLVDVTVDSLHSIGAAEIDGDLNHDGTGVGFYGTAPVAKPGAYTQTYATADKTISAYTADNESAAYAGIDNLQTGSPYARVTDLNALRVAYENLRGLNEDIAQALNAVIDDLQALGLVS